MPAPKEQVAKLKLLLLEDNPGDSRLIEEALREGLGTEFELERVERLSAALERLRAGGIDVVLTDLSVPDSRGLDTLLKQQELAPHLPIVVLTGTYTEALGIEAVRAGAQDYLLKDQLNGEMLRRVLRYAVERKRAEVALQSANRQLQRKLDDIAWLNQIMLEREEAILKLKGEINGLLRELGRRAKYGT